MKFGRAVLWLSVAAWAGFGIMLWGWPERLDGVGLTIDNGLARAEIRAFYGGLEFGIAGFLAFCAMAPPRIRIGLIAGLATIGMTGLGRLTGIAMEGFETNTMMWTLVAIELSAAALTIVALKQLGPSEQAHT